MNGCLPVSAAYVIPKAKTASSSLHSQGSAKCLAPEVIKVHIDRKLTHLPSMFTSARPRVPPLVRQLLAPKHPHVSMLPNLVHSIPSSENALPPSPSAASFFEALGKPSRRWVTLHHSPLPGRFWALSSAHSTFLPLLCPMGWSVTFFLLNCEQSHVLFICTPQPGGQGLPETM